MADLQNILAVLAAQQSQSNTPAQLPPNPGQQYPPHQYASPPPGGQLPYPLPQPISSGSVDLGGKGNTLSKPYSADVIQGRDYGGERSYDPRSMSLSLLLNHTDNLYSCITK